MRKRSGRSANGVNRVQNEGDVYEPNHEDAYWGENYGRLLAVKQR